MVGPAKVPTVASSAFQGAEMRKELRSILRLSVGVVFLWFGWLGVASAYVRGSISPEFIVNSTDYGFGWKATIVVDTSNANCSTTPGECTGASLVSATGQLYDPYPTGQIFPTPTGSSFDFTLSPQSFNDITVFFSGSTPVGIDTNGPIGYYTLALHAAPVLPSTNSPPDPYTHQPPYPNILNDGAYLWLQMSYNAQSPSADLLLLPLCIPTITPRTWERENCGPTTTCIPTDPNHPGQALLTGATQSPDELKFAVVPEPGSIALICCGLLAAGFIRRRQQLH